MLLRLINYALENTIHYLVSNKLANKYSAEAIYPEKRLDSGFCAGFYGAG